MELSLTDIDKLQKIAQLAWEVVNSSEHDVSYRIHNLDQYFNNEVSRELWDWIESNNPTPNEAGG